MRFIKAEKRLILRPNTAAEDFVSPRQRERLTSSQRIFHQFMISSVETPSAPGTRWLNVRPLLVEEIWESELVCCEEVASFYPSSNPAKIKNEHSFRSLLTCDEGNNASTFKGKKTFVPLSFPLFYLKVFSFLSSDRFWSHNPQSISSLFYNYHRFMEDIPALC